MSIIFRVKYKLGFVPSANKIDSEWNRIAKTRDRLYELQNSDEFKRFNELDTLVRTSEFQKRKNEIENLKYSGSKEESVLKEYSSLEKDKQIKRYFKILKSAGFERYNRILESDKLSQYKDLDKVVNSVEFLRRGSIIEDKKSDRTTDDLQVLNYYNTLSKDSDIKFWLKFSDSEEFKVFNEVNNSKKLGRYYELKKTVSDEEFIKRVNFLKNKNRYKETEESRIEEEYRKALNKGGVMKEYRKLKKSKEAEFLERWEIVFDETFSADKLESDKWLFHDFWGNKNFGDSFSQANELQCYRGEQNLEVSNNVLSIVTRKEKAEGKVWSPQLGIAIKEFGYTSGMINTGESFRINEGVVEAKIRFKALTELTNAFSVKGDKAFPQIDIFRSGNKCIHVGVFTKNGKGIKSENKKIAGLNFNKFHVYRLELSGKSLIWKVNGSEVYKKQLNEPAPDMFLNFLTAVHMEARENYNLPHRMEIDWIRCIKKT